MSPGLRGSPVGGRRLDGGGGLKVARRGSSGATCRVVEDIRWPGRAAGMRS
jgi:hypothetical protein